MLEHLRQPVADLLFGCPFSYCKAEIMFCAGRAGWGIAMLILLKLRVSEFVPEPLGDAPAIVVQVVAREVLADVLNIACQQRESIGVETRIDSLREVDNFCLPLPEKDVARREISVHIVVGQ